MPTLSENYTRPIGIKISLGVFYIVFLIIVSSIIWLAYQYVALHVSNSAPPGAFGLGAGLLIVFVIIPATLVLLITGTVVIKREQPFNSQQYRRVRIILRSTLAVAAFYVLYSIAATVYLFIKP